MKKTICLLLCVLMIASTVSVTAFAKTDFTDIDSNAWYYKAVNWCSKKGYMNGTSTNTFSPDGIVTREMFLTVLASYDGADLTVDFGALPFTDVSANAWYSKSVAWAYTNKLCSGVDEKTFGVGQQVSRAQLAVFLKAYAEYKGFDTDYSADLSAFTDIPEGDIWYKNAFSWAVAEKLISGTSETTANPSGNATRAQLAVILYSFNGYVQENTVPDKENIHDGFVPVLRFVIASDVHISKSDPLPSENLENMFRQAYAYADSHKTYKKLDAVIMVGDITETADETEYAEYNKIVSENIREGTQMISTLGNHEFQNSHRTADETCALLGIEPDSHSVINGVHFIGLSPIDEGEQAYYTKYEWLKTQLADAKKDTGTSMPIIVFQHHPQYSSQDGVTKDFDNILSGYSGIINFSGHWHSALSRKTLYQSKYTAVNMGTLGSYTSNVSYDSTAKSYYEEARSYMIVEIDASGAVFIRPYSVNSDRFFRTTSNIDNPDTELNFLIKHPWDKSEFEYVGGIIYSEAPYFARHDTINISAVAGTSVTFTFPRAKSANGITHYTVVVKDESGAVAVSRNYNGYNHLEDAPITYTKYLGGLTSKITYTLTITGYDASNYVTATPLTVTFTTK